MYSSIDYYLDDQGQIYFTALENLDYELMQADRCFGFNNEIIVNPSVTEIEKALLTNQRFSNLDQPAILDFLLQEPLIAKLETWCEGKRANSTGFGFPGFALISEKNDLWLLLRDFDELQTDIMGQVINSLSDKFKLFLVDTEVRCVVESSQKSGFLNYLDHKINGV